MIYQEEPTSVPGVQLWRRRGGPSIERIRILPDGCLDLIWDGRRLFVAGPDSAARLHDSPPGTDYVALRFSGGTGPALLGLPADEVTDRSVPLDELWASRAARRLTEAVTGDPAFALEAFVRERSATVVDPLGRQVLALAAVAAVCGYADQAHLSREVRLLAGTTPTAFTPGPYDGAGRSA